MKLVFKNKLFSFVLFLILLLTTIPFPSLLVFAQSEFAKGSGSPLDPYVIETKEQLDNWANQHNPNNKAYQANADNHSNQKNPKHKTHQAIHNSNRRNKVSSWPEWAPDYPEYDD